VELQLDGSINSRFFRLDNLNVTGNIILEIIIGTVFSAEDLR
jgi:hypothetical protein